MKFALKIVDCQHILRPLLRHLKNPELLEVVGYVKPLAWNTLAVRHTYVIRKIYDDFPSNLNYAE